jgi:hypothetical protein
MYIYNNRSANFILEYMKHIFFLINFKLQPLIIYPLFLFRKIIFNKKLKVLNIYFIKNGFH